MKTNGISQVIKTLGETFSKNSPTILTALAVGGLVTTAIFAVRATPKALNIIECERQERWDKEEVDPRDFDDYTLPKLDVLKIAWKCYIPTAAVGLATVGCIIGANHISLRRNAALASLYGITEAAFKEYQAKVVETIGHNKELKVRDEIAADRVKRNPPGTNEVVFTGKGEVLCYDSLSGRYFKNDIEQIRKSINTLNYNLRSEMFITLNDLYYAIGLAGTKLGDEMGWDVDRGEIVVSYSSTLTDDGDPCLVLNYDVIPRFMEER